MSRIHNQPLVDFQPSRDFFIGIDSDGCVFDTMEIKHKECFIPNTIKHFGLQPVSKYAREAAEFVNLYSKWRGVNRFPALLQTLDLLGRRREVLDRETAIEKLPATRTWLEREISPGNPGLEAAVAVTNGDTRRELLRVLEWSRAVNAMIEDMVYGVPPFPFVRQSIERASASADIVVVSATPGEALQREWDEHGLAQHVAVIAGQEMGTKRDHLRLATEGKYPKHRVLMIGDAPGDLKAARANDVLFYPIIPGAEAQSWQRFREEALDRFLDETYAGRYEADLIAEFETRLPAQPPWES